MAFSCAVGCHGAEGQGLPPPTGSGAPPLASIPKLTELGAGPGELASPSAQAAWTGTLFARHEAQLGPKATGVLSQLTVEEGDHVKKGQLLFRLDAAQASLGVSQAKAAIASAEVGYDAAKLDLSRAAELVKGGSIAPAAYDQAKSGFDRAATGLEQAKVALQMADHGAADTAIYSPIDGVVTAKLKSLGETVTMMPPTVVLVVQDVDRLELRAKLPERALASVQVGSALRMVVPTVAITREVPVKRINPTIDPRTRTVEVVADVDNSDGRLKVGMLVEVASAGGPAAKADEPKPGLATVRKIVAGPGSTTP
jgi:RND family efflux transporter MFP subunit